MSYRDDLTAAKLRITLLESELSQHREEIEATRRGAEDASGVLRRWLGPAVAIMAMMGSLLLWLERHPAERRASLLERQLKAARAEVMIAREEARAALEAIHQLAEPHKPAQIEVPAVYDASESERASAEPPSSSRSSTEPESEPDAPSDDHPVVSTVELGQGSAVVWADSEPPATLVLDGKSYGRTPLMVRVPPGDHALAFVHAQRGIVTRTVTVSEGETLRTKVHLDGSAR